MARVTGKPPYAAEMQAHQPIRPASLLVVSVSICFVPSCYFRCYCLDHTGRCGATSLVRGCSIQQHLSPTKLVASHPTALLDTIVLQMDGSDVPLNGVAQVSVRKGNTLIVSVFDPEVRGRQWRPNVGPPNPEIYSPHCRHCYNLPVRVRVRVQGLLVHTHAHTHVTLLRTTLTACVLSCRRPRLQ